MRLFLALLLSSTAAPALAQGGAPPPAPAPDWSRTEGPIYIPFRCDGGFVYFESTSERYGARRLWLDDEDVIRTLTYSTADSVYTDGTYTADSERRVFVRRRGLALRENCVQDRGEPVEHAEGRPGVRLAWGRMNPKPLTTHLRIPGTTRGLWVGPDLLVLDRTTVEEVEVSPTGRPGIVAVGVRLAPEAARVLEAASVEHLAQPMALLMDGVLVTAALVREPIRGGFSLVLPQAAADRLHAAVE